MLRCTDCQWHATTISIFDDHVDITIDGRLQTANVNSKPFTPLPSTIIGSLGSEASLIRAQIAGKQWAFSPPLVGCIRDVQFDADPAVPVLNFLDTGGANHTDVDFECSAEKLQGTVCACACVC